jgi:hypothetical protein
MATSSEFALGHEIVFIVVREWQMHGKVEIIKSVVVAVADGQCGYPQLITVVPANHSTQATLPLRQRDTIRSPRL